MPSGTLHLSRI
jgi:hypothetical protein